MTLVDSNVLLDIFTRTRAGGSGRWHSLRTRLSTVHFPINDVIFAETSIRFPLIKDFEAALAEAEVSVAPMPRMALFLAGKASVQYRNAGGVRSSVLPDFFIGAHATVEQLPLLTRDTRRYRTYFPTVN